MEIKTKCNVGDVVIFKQEAKEYRSAAGYDVKIAGLSFGQITKVIAQPEIKYQIMDMSISESDIVSRLVTEAL